MINERIIEAARRSAKMVVRSSLFSKACQVFRPSYLSQDGGVSIDPSGVRLLDMDDSVDVVSHDFLFNGICLERSSFNMARQTSMADVLIGENDGTSTELLIFSEDQISGINSGENAIRCGDLIVVEIKRHGNDTYEESPKLVFEVVGVNSPTAIPPYLSVYMCHRHNGILEII